MVGSVTLFKALGALSLLVGQISARLPIDKRQSINIDTYIANQGPVSKAGILANIGPNGSKDGGAGSGVVIASPSTSDPDYLSVRTFV
jgi:hypothetical protein